MKGYSIHWLKDVNLSLKCCRTSLKGTLSGILRLLCKSQLDLTGRIATDYGKTSGKKSLFSGTLVYLVRPFANI